MCFRQYQKDKKLIAYKNTIVDTIDLFSQYSFDKDKIN